jgi:hypothetical protein
MTETHIFKSPPAPGAPRADQTFENHVVYFLVFGILAFWHFGISGILAFLAF